MIDVKLLGPFHWTLEREVLASVHGPVLRTPQGTFALRGASRSGVTRSPWGRCRWSGTVPGDTTRTLWTEYLPFERLP